jgi:hypothetical protein
MTIQQITLQYHVTGALNGSTPAPPFTLDPGSSDYVAPSENGVYEFDVSGNLGVLEVPFYGGVADGYRMISAFWLSSGVAGAADAVLDIYDRNSEAFVTRIASLATSASFYRKGILIPQGTRLVVSGFAASAIRKVIRYNILVPATNDDFAALQRASRLYPLA